MSPLDPPIDKSDPPDWYRYNPNSDDNSPQRYHFDNRADLCNNCKRIPWTNMLQESSNHSEQTMLAKKEFSPPRVPICQSCRILRTFVEQQESQEGTYEPAGHISEHEASTERSLHNRADLLRLLSWIPQDKTSLFQPGSGDSARRLDQPQPTDASQVKRWIIKCEREHKINCTIDPKAQEYLRDLRVIDCESNTVVPAPTDCRYVALSYVWGQQRSASETLLDPPETIAHSIHFARELGYRYLWIDKYCIDQMDAKDKHTQISQMGEIYAAAQITLVAAAGKDPTYGLPGVHSESRSMLRRESPESAWMNPLPLHFPLANVAKCTWASRAWTFQEFHRAKRRLIFTDYEVIFVCNSGVEHEKACDFRNRTQEMEETDHYWLQRWLPQRKDLPTSLDRDLNPMYNAIYYATSYLAAYSQRELTYDSDALHAIAGALDPLVDNVVDYIWGVPFCRLDENLPERQPHHHEYISRQFGGRRLIKRIISGWTDWTDWTKEAQKDAITMPNRLQTPMALLWYHESPCRRRQGSPSWSSLGWTGPIRWEDDSVNGRGCVIADIFNAKVHFPSVVSSGVSGISPTLSLDLQDWRSKARDLEMTAFTNTTFAQTPPRLELSVKSIELTLRLNQGPHADSRPIPASSHLVSLELGNDYKISFPVLWDADPIQLSTTQLRGALLDTWETGSRQSVMVLSPHDGCFERVGLILLPPSIYDIGSTTKRTWRSDQFRLRRIGRGVMQPELLGSHHGAFFWRHDPGGLVREEEEVEADRISNHLWIGTGKFWNEVFEENGPIMIK